MPVLGLQHVNIRTPDLARTIAFFRDEIRDRIKALGLEFFEHRLPQFSQILVREPNGILFELNFPGDSA